MPPGIGFGVGLGLGRPPLIDPTPLGSLAVIQTEAGDDLLTESGDPMTMES